MVASKKPLLFTPFALRGVTVPNRVVISPMQTYAARDGLANDWHFQHLAKYAVGGSGLVFTEVLLVEPRGRNTHADLGIWSDEQIPPLARIAEFLRDNGAMPGVQIGHCGPKAARQRPWEGLQPLGPEDAARGEPPWVPASATGEPAAPGYHLPHALTPGEIAGIVEAFGAGARRCAQAGFDILEVHAAHGYLIHSFYSPISNDRTDAYGGDFRGRIRFALEVAEAVRANWPDDKAVSFRLSCEDRLDGGWSLSDTVVLAKELEARGVDVIDCSGGGIRGANTLMNLERARQPVRPCFQAPYAETVRREAGMATMAVGVILTGRQAEDILRKGQADLIAVAREALYDPHWALHAAIELGADPEWRLWPPQYGWWLYQRDRTGIEADETEEDLAARNVSSALARDGEGRT
jgi:2,4-dienoyl-CoA reductase-like NADH-dependent reductase (Old Yellow Enzyme family)